MWKLASLSFAFEIWCGELSLSSAAVTLLVSSDWTKIQQLSLWRRHAWCELWLMKFLQKPQFDGLLFYFKTKENASSDDKSSPSLR